MSKSTKKSEKFDLEEFKRTIKVADTPIKPDKFIVLNECLHEVLGVPGIPLGHITQVYAKSDQGKTSLMFHAAACAQQQGILPVFIITEGKVDWERAETMGVDRKNAIINEECEFLEDVFKFIDRIASAVHMGELPKDVCIFFDSVGNTLSEEEVEIKDDGTYERKSTMMKAAKVLSTEMRIISKKINNTRKESSPYFCGLFIVNNAYDKPPAFPGGMTTLVPYGGNAIWLKSSLVLKMQRTKKLSAKKEGIEYGYGIVSKITVDKNHITPTTNSGEFVITGADIIPYTKSALDKYKEDHKEEWGSSVEAYDSTS